MFDLAGRTALVTGASGGIGGAIARALHARGATVMLSGTRAAALEALKDDLGPRVHAAVCDLHDSTSIEKLSKAAEEALGGMDILVNNAGITRDNLFLRMKDAEWDDVIAIDLTAAFRLSRAFLRGMMKRRWGRIVTITSVVGTTGNPGQGNYAAAKAGLVGMTKSLAQEVASRNITVNCVAPGFIETEMVAAIPQHILDGIIEKVPLRRLGRPDEVARVVRFLLEDESSYITGALYTVNGGMFT